MNSKSLKTVVRLFQHNPSRFLITTSTLSPPHQQPKLDPLKLKQWIEIERASMRSDAAGVLDIELLENSISKVWNLKLEMVRIPRQAATPLRDLLALYSSSDALSRISDKHLADLAQVYAGAKLWRESEGMSAISAEACKRIKIATAADSPTRFSSLAFRILMSFAKLRYASSDLINALAAHYVKHSNHLETIALEQLSGSVSAFAVLGCRSDELFAMFRQVLQKRQTEVFDDPDSVSKVLWAFGRQRKTIGDFATDAFRHLRKTGLDHFNERQLSRLVYSVCLCNVQRVDKGLKKRIWEIVMKDLDKLGDFERDTIKQLIRFACDPDVDEHTKAAFVQKVFGLIEEGKLELDQAEVQQAIVPRLSQLPKRKGPFRQGISIQSPGQPDLGNTNYKHLE
eukprot:TRINITY_DN33680_c0_g1_i3.p1 TRINITY_DN33680_c0_g1~~TRINITY_DN33680_c0_g1_i3.p1  ORF type:complete len:406 (+),score=92.90 TRINITY_DN33680_c0_g1_i3:25-1218(+)